MNSPQKNLQKNLQEIYNMSVFSVKFLLPAMLLFIILSPGFLLHLPLPDKDGDIIKPLSGNTSLSAKVFHSVVYVTVLAGVLHLLGVRLHF
jgi:hypothetical protein